MLVLEAGLRIGTVLPAGSLVLGLGVLAGVGVVSLPLVALTVAAATVLGAALGHRAVRRRSGDELLVAGGVLGRRLPGRATRLIDRTTTPWRETIGRRPVRAAATAQFIVGARTLAPRLAALPLVRDPLTVAGVPLALVAATWLLVRRRARLGAAHRAGSSA